MSIIQNWAYNASIILKRQDILKIMPA